MVYVKDSVVAFHEKYTVNPSGCWEWHAAMGSTGYGAMRFYGKKEAAHRAAWMIYHGDIPEDMHICHHCDNRKCVNPDHLFVGSRQDNMDDMKRKGRQVKGDTHPQSKLREEDIFRIFEMRRDGMSLKKIAQHFKVDAFPIHKIVIGHHWKYLHPKLLERGFVPEPKRSRGWNQYA